MLQFKRMAVMPQEKYESRRAYPAFIFINHPKQEAIRQKDYPESCKMENRELFCPTTAMPYRARRIILFSINICHVQFDIKM
ncbi:MAG: hypothetical protein D6677_09310 [Calditrichaeota bacterium]|nr:MAG: hypothetical protein D6677_09310 [Calditrichota bacterium]